MSEEYVKQFEAIVAETQQLTDPLTRAQFNWRAAPGTWSIAECLGHLLITERGSLSQLDRLIAEAKSLPGAPGRARRHSFLGEFFIWAAEPPYRMKVKTFKFMTPPAEAGKAEVVGQFTAMQRDLQERVRQAQGLNVSAVRARFPAGIALDLDQWFRFVLAHERRHLWQAQNVRRRPEFPA